MTRSKVVAIGAFDGIHRGHQEILALTQSLANQHDLQAAIVTFEPHPRDVLRPDSPVFRLTSSEIKHQLIAALGNFEIHTVPFTPEFSQLSAEAFIDDILIRTMQAKHIIVGYNFHFGKNRKGTPEFLQQYSALRNVDVTLVPQYCDEGGNVISSSRVRDFLRQGDIAQANAMLGYVWRIKSQVVHGKKIGRTLGFPTANIQVAPSFALKFGIYAVKVFLADGRDFMGVVSFGTRPQFDDGLPVLETYIIGLNEDIYGQDIVVQFIAFLREEQKFANVDALITQMQQDVLEACTAISSLNLKTVIPI